MVHRVLWVCLVFIIGSCGSAQTQRLPGANDHNEGENKTVEQQKNGGSSKGYMQNSNPSVKQKGLPNIMTSSQSSGMAQANPMAMPNAFESVMTNPKMVPKVEPVAQTAKELSPGRQLLYKYCLHCHEQFKDSAFFSTQARPSYESIARRRMPKNFPAFENSQDRKDLLNWLAKSYSAGPLVD